MGADRPFLAVGGLWPKARVLSPLARGTTGGVERTSEDPLPQKRGVPLGKGGQR
jgi:hypothetical protein